MRCTTVQVLYLPLFREKCYVAYVSFQHLMEYTDPDFKLIQIPIKVNRPNETGNCQICFINENMILKS